MKKGTKRRGGIIRFAGPGTPVTQGFRLPQQHGPTPFGAHAATLRDTVRAGAVQAAASAASAHAQAAYALAAEVGHASPPRSRKRRQSRSRSRTRNSTRRMSH